MKLTAYALAAVASLALAACYGENDNAKPEDALVKINKSVLTRSDLNVAMPGGLNPADSAKFARAYIRSWVDSKLVSQEAAKQVDMTNIDRMVEQYRNELIMLEYSRLMFDSHAIEVPEDSVRSYYERHKDELVLTRPMVKGVYLKVAEDAKTLPELRKLYRSQKQDDIDNLDKSMLNGAVHYDYFRDRWVDWEQIEMRIPYDFGSSADTWLRGKKNLDTTTGGFTYLLDVTDVLHTGETMPYEAAKPIIEDRLRFSDRRNYTKQLKKQLYENALSKGKITLFCELD